MNCHFCHLLVANKDLTITSTTNQKRNLIIRFCYQCQAEYFFWGSNSLFATHLYTTINHKMYRWSKYQKTNALWYIAEPGIPGIKFNKGTTCLKVFQDILPLTPQNVNQKIKQIILWM